MAKWLGKKWVLGAALMGSTAAWAFPWDIDMVDAVFLRAYEWKMMALPEGAVSTNRFVATEEQRSMAYKYMPEGMALQNPYPTDEASVANGKRMFEVYCATCHGPEGRGGAEVAKHDPDNGFNRYPMPPPILSGAGAITGFKSDAYLYLTIRNGGALMPSYSYAMDDDEMWAIVSYIRTLEGGAQAAPAGQ
mgnify:CR=1 FL=1